MLATTVQYTFDDAVNGLRPTTTSPSLRLQCPELPIGLRAAVVFQGWIINGSVQPTSAAQNASLAASSPWAWC